MNRAHERRVANREIRAALHDMAWDQRDADYTMDWGLIGHCAYCDGLVENGVCFEGPSWGCPSKS